MHFFNRLRIQPKVLLLVGLVLVLGMISNVFVWTQIRSIGFEIEAIAERDMPLVEAITQIEVHQLEQSIHFERILRLEITDHVKEGALEHEIEAFEELAKKVDEELIAAEELIIVDLEADHISEAEKVELNNVLTQIRTLEKEHADYDHEAEAVFAAYKQGMAEEEIEHLIEITEQEEIQINHEVEALLKEIELFTEEALLAAEVHEHQAETTMMISAAVTVVLGLLLGIVISRGISKPVTLMTNTMSELAEGNMEVDIPNLGVPNEIGDMATAIGFFKENAIKIKENERREKTRMEEEATAKGKAEEDERAATLRQAENDAAAKAKIEAEKREAMLQLADDLDQSTSIIITQIVDGTGNILMTANGMSGSIDKTSTLR